MPALIFSPPFDAARIVALGTLLAALALAGYWRGRGQAGWPKKVFLGIVRLAVIGALVVILLRPMKETPLPQEREKADFLVLVDTSASMNTLDVGDSTRLQAVLAQLRGEKGAFVARLRRRYDVRVFEFSAELRPTTFASLLQRSEATGQETDLSTALSGVPSVAGRRKLAGSLLLSDGRENAGAGAIAAANRLKMLKVPVWTSVVGTATQTKDVWVNARLSQNFLFAGQPASLRIGVSHSGYRGRYVKVDVYRDDEYLATRQVILRSGTVQVNVPIREERKGVYRYRVQVEPLRGEADARNNKRTLFVRVVDEKSRVLVLEAQPYWDSKFLLRALRANPHLEVTAIFQINERKRTAIREKISAATLQKQTARTGVRIPRSKEELYQYDCIILGRGIDRILSAADLKLLQAYLTERGGSVVFARGKAYDGENPDLARLEPVVWDRLRRDEARFELTSTGKASPIFAFGGAKSAETIIRELPAMISITRVVEEKSLAIILARSKSGGRGPHIATISYQRYGKGKVMSIGAAGLWRWAFLPEKLKEYDNVYQRFWNQMIRWLIDESDFLPGQDISFATDRYSYNKGETVRLVVRTKHVDARGYAPVIRIHAPAGRQTTIKPINDDPDNLAVYTAYFTPEGEGEFKAVLHNNVGEPKEDAAMFTVYQDLVETRQVAANPELMAQIAKITGGEVIPLDQLGSLPEKVAEFARLSRDRVKPEDVWDKLRFFCLVVGLLALEWFVRRRSGLV